MEETLGGAAYSTDGVNWTFFDLFSLGGRGGTIYGNKIFLVLTNNKVRRINTASGVVFKGISIGSWLAGGYGNNRWVLVKNNAVTISTDDTVSWTNYTPTLPNPTGVAYGNGYFVTCRNGNTFYRSTDGITWTAFSVTSSAYSRIIYDEASSMFVAVSTTAILTLTNNPPTMAEYKTMSTNFDSRNISITSGGGVVVIVGGNTTTSPNTSTIVAHVNPIQFVKTDYDFSLPLELVMSNPDTQQFVSVLRNQTDSTKADLLTAPWPVA